MILFKKLRYKNLLSSGNQFTEIDLNSFHTNLIIGSNGGGKCFSINTKVRLRNKLTGEIIETTIGELYDSQKKSPN